MLTLITTRKFRDEIKNNMIYKPNVLAILPSSQLINVHLNENKSKQQENINVIVILH